MTAASKICLSRYRLTVDLALIFQPGVLSHPDHAMRPREHVLSQQVLEFLISHQDDLLFGLQPVGMALSEYLNYH